MRPIINKILDRYSLPMDGLHGVAHWARVLENGLRLSRSTGADISVVTLFAVFHDSRRINEGTDPEHGRRGADFAKKHRALFDLSDAQFNLLYRACEGHTDELNHPDITVQTCWDADRLDLGRVGISPDPYFLGTAIAKSKETIQWADGRATFHVVPKFVSEDWGIDLTNEGAGSLRSW